MENRNSSLWFHEQSVQTAVPAALGLALLFLGRGVEPSPGCETSWCPGGEAEWLTCRGEGGGRAERGGGEGLLQPYALVPSACPLLRPLAAHASASPAAATWLGSAPARTVRLGVSRSARQARQARRRLGLHNPSRPGNYGAFNTNCSDTTGPNWPTLHTRTDEAKPHRMIHNTTLALAKIPLF